MNFTSFDIWDVAITDISIVFELNLLKRSFHSDCDNFLKTHLKQIFILVKKILSNSYQDVHSDGYEIIYLSLTINSDYLDENQLIPSTNDSFINLGLRCTGQQMYPNGSVIYQSSTQANLKVVLKGKIWSILHCSINNSGSF